MTKTVVVLGATGKQGGSVIDTFLQEPGWNVRGLTRNPESASSQSLAAKGVEVVKGDLDDPSSLSAAFQEAHAIFAVTDFWTPMLDPSSQEKVKAGQTIQEWALDLEVQRGKNIIDAAASIVGKPLERFIWSALSDVKGRSRGKYTWVYHFDGKAVITKYIHEAQPKLAEITSTVQIGLYSSNPFMFPPFAPQKRPDGTYEFSAPVEGDAPFPWMVVEKDGGKFVKLLIESPPGRNILAYSAMMSHNEYARIFGEVNGVKARFVKNTLEDWDRDYPPLGREVAESFLYVEELGFDGADPDVTHPRDLDVMVTDVEQWMREQDWSSLL